MSAFLATALSLISVANGGEMRMSSDMSVRVCVLLHRSSLSCIYIYIYIYIYIQGESLARGPKLLSIKNYVIEIMN